eukprot:2809566-Alexandrium_andersonii.AAC.1
MLRLVFPAESLLMHEKVARAIQAIEELQGEGFESERGPLRNATPSKAQEVRCVFGDGAGVAAVCCDELLQASCGEVLGDGVCKGAGGRCQAAKRLRLLARRQLRGKIPAEVAGVGEDVHAGLPNGKDLLAGGGPEGAHG